MARGLELQLIENVRSIRIIETRMVVRLRHWLLLIRRVRQLNRGMLQVGLVKVVVNAIMLLLVKGVDLSLLRVELQGVIHDWLLSAIIHGRCSSLLNLFENLLLILKFFLGEAANPG